MTIGEIDKRLVLEAFDTLFDLRDYEAAKRAGDTSPPSRRLEALSAGAESVRAGA
jgi:hypothetical protein